jgi:alpha-tubulin suppressor-like RCC1 family protein
MTSTLLVTLRRTLCTLATLSLLTACGGDGDAVQMIGAAGGTVTGAGGAQVVVPAGALGTDTAIEVVQSSSGSPALPAGLAASGQVFAFTPHGTSFAAAVTVSVPFSAAAVPTGATVMLFKTNSAGAWVQVPNATASAGMLTAQVTGFSWFTPVVMAVADVQVTEPGTATFNVSASGFNAPFSYQWEKSDDAGMTSAVIGGATTSSYTTGSTATTIDNGDLYRVRVSNSLDTAYSNWARLTVTGTIVAPTITTHPQSQSVASGGNAGFSVVATGSSLVYQWQKNGVPIAGQTSASLNLTNVQAGDAGSYTVVVSNLASGAPINSITSNPATLTVTAQPPAATGARIAAGSDFSFARLANGNLVSWGSDAAGTLGAGPGDQSRNVPGTTLVTSATAVAAGGSHGLAVVGNGGGYRGWGYNGFGQLGDGSNLSRESPVNPPFNYPDAVEACGGTLHSLIRRANGEVRALGYNMNGQLGDGTNTNSTAAPYSVAVSGISNASAIACSGNHSLALLADGTVRSWGANNAGQLGDGTTTSRNAPVTVAGLFNVIAIAAGAEHSLALRNDGSVWAWGSNVNGKLGDGTTANRLTPGATLLTSGITVIAAGYMNSVALRGADGVVLSWGINETGQLGNGGTSPGFRPQPAAVINLTNVVAISFGSGSLGHGLAVRTDGTVWAWGDNGMGTNNNGVPIFGKLGNGSAAPFSATPVQVTGLNLN